MIIVKPTGVYGQGKTRFYPDVLPHEVDNAWSYARRLSATINADTGHPYVPAGAVGTFMYASAKGNHAETVDAWLYPEQYWDEAEAARQGRMVERDKQPKAPGTGPFPYRELRLADAQYLNWCCGSNPAKYRDVWMRCVDGTWLEICQLSMAAIYAGEFDAASYSGPLREVVAAVYP